MAHEIPFTRIVRDLPATIPFVGPEAIERRLGREFDVRVGANESAFGVSPRAAVAMREAIERTAWYGDPEGYDLRSAIAAAHGVGLDEVGLAGGIDELLGLTVRMLIEPGMPVVTSLGGYPTFNYHVAGHGGELHRVPYRDDHNDLEALAAKAHETGAALVYLANPDNPMGTGHDAGAVRRFIASLPSRTTLILDEAYADFAPPEAALEFDTSDWRVVRMRTFSKAHGMAGARVGYAVAAAEMVAGYARIRNHFGMSRISLAGALASFADAAFIAGVRGAVAEGREDYYRLADRLGLDALRSATNFVAIDVGGGDRARRLLAALEARGVFVRMPGVAPLDRCIRVTVGTPAERARFAEVLEQTLPAVN